ncbi:hypothetical protein COOONC_21718, partial [Cooperia oncophora]
MGTIYSASFTIWGWIGRDNEVIPFCNPPLGLAPNVSRIWSITNVIINTVVVFVYAVIIVLVRVKGILLHCFPMFPPRNSSAYRENQKAIRRLKVIVIIFVCSWYMAIL